MCCSSQTSEVSHDICARKVCDNAYQIRGCSCTRGLQNSQRGKNAPARSEMFDCAVSNADFQLCLSRKDGHKVRRKVTRRLTNGLSSDGFEFQWENTGLSKRCPAFTSSTESCGKHLKKPLKRGSNRLNRNQAGVSIFSLFHSRKATFYFIARFYPSLF